MRRLLKNRVVAISSSGGHLTELQESIPEGVLKYVTYVTSEDGRTRNTLRTVDHFFISEPNGLKWKYGLTILQSLVLFLKLRPAVVISTGSGLAVPFLVLSKLFGSFIIFIESGARIDSASKAGKVMYVFSDVFIVQYKSLLKFYPNAIIASLK